MPKYEVTIKTAAQVLVIQDAPDELEAKKRAVMLMTTKLIEVGNSRVSVLISDTEVTGVQPMAPNKPITKEGLLEEFREWSGGFSPDECGHNEIDTFLDYAMGPDVSREEAEKLLEELR